MQHDLCIHVGRMANEWSHALIWPKPEADIVVAHTSFIPLPRRLRTHISNWLQIICTPDRNLQYMEVVRKAVEAEPKVTKVTVCGTRKKLKLTEKKETTCEFEAAERSEAS